MSDRGKLQSERLARRLATFGRLEAIYASPLLRPRETAAPIAAVVGVAVRPLPAVMEYDFGDLSGLTWTEVGERDPDLIASLRSRNAEYPHYPGEEGRESFRERVCTALWGLGDIPSSEHQIAIVTHAGPILVFCLEVLGLPYQRPAPFAFDNASITTIDACDGSGKLISTNDTCHLAGVETPRGSTGPAPRPAG